MLRFSPSDYDAEIKQKICADCGDEIDPDTERRFNDRTLFCGKCWPKALEAALKFARKKLAEIARLTRADVPETSTGFESAWLAGAAIGNAKGYFRDCGEPVPEAEVSTRGINMRAIQRRDFVAAAKRVL